MSWIKKGLFVFFSILTLFLSINKLYFLAIICYLFPLYYFFTKNNSIKESITFYFSLGIYLLFLMYSLVNSFKVDLITPIINSNSVAIIINGLYVILTFAMFKEMQTQRKDAYKPNLIFEDSFFYFGSVSEKNHLPFFFSE